MVKILETTMIKLISITIAVPCPKCGKDSTVCLSAEEFEKLQKGELISRNSFKNLSAAEREILISGICDDCWNKIFPPEEED